MAVHNIDINFDEILRIALVGITRAATFMGYGINAAEDPSFKSYELTKFTSIQLVSPDLSDDRIAEDKRNFRRWIEANGLRELAESFSLFADAIHHACIFIARNGEVPAEFDAIAVQKRFSQKGLRERLEILRTNFNIVSTYADQLVSINQGRNCLTHRWGIVGLEDVRGDELKLSWLAIDKILREPNGNEIIWRHDSESIHLPDGGEVLIRVTMHERVFKVGEQLSISTEELAEICWFYEQAARQLYGSALAYAKSEGVEIRSTKLIPQLQDLPAMAKDVIDRTREKK